MSIRFFPLLACLAFLASCRDPQKKSADPAAGNPEARNRKALMAGNFSNQHQLRFDSATLDSFLRSHPNLAAYDSSLHSFYRKRSWSYAWFDTAGLIEPAALLHDRLHNISAEGIRATPPYEQELDSAISSAGEDPQSRLKLELLNTGLYFFYASTVWQGLDESASGKMDWFLPRKKVSYEHWLDSFLSKKDETIKAPVYRQYQLLRDYLARYRTIAESGRWTVLNPSKNIIRPGDSLADIPAIRLKLFLTGDLDADTTSPVFDDHLKEAVKSFQHRFGMKEDGIIGKSLVKELNTPIHNRIATILINMERSRWLPVAMEGDYLAVNIPEFRLHVYRGDSLLWDMNVVVGKSLNKTVIFSGKLQYIVFSPYWNIPESIVKNEILPGIKRNSSYLASHHMEAYGGGYRQRPGPWNSLGQVKFLFPNSYSIYFHDTPSKSLFGEEKRAFSHGCIRLAEPAKLAAYLLRQMPAWTTEKITAAMRSGKEQYVTLKENIPVFITYFTSWVDRQGRLNFRDDVYARDKRLEEMLID
jgi:murein L,D-transpeptidase YcbB/YkuD